MSFFSLDPIAILWAVAGTLINEVKMVTQKSHARLLIVCDLTFLYISLNMRSVQLVLSCNPVAL